MNWFSCYLSLLFAFCISHLCSTIRAHEKLVFEAKVPAVFAFGDSIMDTGNNNEIFTLAKSNFPPYGRDFDQAMATGRFGNGRILSDFLVEALGVKKNLPAYLDPNLQESDLLTGVCFASASSGYDDLTSMISFVKTMEDELKMFKEYKGKMKEIFGEEITNFILNNSVSFLVAGSNDVTSYFNSPFRRDEYDLDSYTDFLTTSASTIIKRLHKLGAQKIVVINVPTVGCSPIQRTLGGGPERECANEMNQVAQMFNTKLANELESLNAKLPNCKLVYIDYYSIMLDLIVNATFYGFEVVDKGCCGTGLVETAVLCNPFSSMCNNHEKYLFWDCCHPAEITYLLISDKIAEKYFKFLF